MATLLKQFYTREYWATIRLCTCGLPAVKAGNVQKSVVVREMSVVLV